MGKAGLKSNSEFAGANSDFIEFLHVGLKIFCFQSGRHLPGSYVFGILSTRVNPQAREGRVIHLIIFKRL